MSRNKIGDTETNFDIRTIDSGISIGEYRALPRHPLILVLDNLRSAFNVGALFRLADCLRLEAIFLCGCTACPPNPKLLKTSMGTIDFVEWRYFSTTIEAVAELRSRRVMVWAAETVEGAISYEQAQIPDHLALILGNEALGVDSELLPLCDAIVEIPVYGLKNSLNVAQSCAVLGYHVVGRMQANKKAPEQSVQELLRSKEIRG